MSNESDQAAAKVVHDAKNIAQTVLATAVETAHALLEATNSSPVITELREEFKTHAAIDGVFMERQGESNKRQAEVNESTTKSLAAIHERIGDLATTKDIEDLKTMLDNWRVGIGIFKFGWNNIGQVAVAIVAIYLIAKVGLFGLVAYFWGKLP